MVGVVGSSPIEPTNENRMSGECLISSGIQRQLNALSAQGEYGYDTANVDRNFFGTTLVEDLFRPVSLLVSESECGPSKAGPHFFYSFGSFDSAHLLFWVVAANRLFSMPRGIAEGTQ